MKRSIDFNNIRSIYRELIFRANQQRSQKIFKAQQPMDLTQVRTKLQGFGMQLLDGIDPNPDNFVCAGIVHMRAQQVGCLLRLEPNKQAQVTCPTLEKYSEQLYQITNRVYAIFCKVYHWQDCTNLAGNLLIV